MCPHNCVTNLPKPRQKHPGKKTMCPLVKASVEAGLWLLQANYAGCWRMLKKVRPWSTRFLSVLAIFRVDLTTFAKQWKKWYFMFITDVTCNENFLFLSFSSLCFYCRSKQKVVNQSEREKNQSHFLKPPWIINEFAQQEEGKTLVRDKRDKAITCVLCRGLHLTVMFSGRFTKRSV